MLDNININNKINENCHNEFSLLNWHFNSLRYVFDEQTKIKASDFSTEGGQFNMFRVSWSGDSLRSVKYTLKNLSDTGSSTINLESYIL